MRTQDGRVQQRLDGWLRGNRIIRHRHADSRRLTVAPLDVERGLITVSIRPIDLSFGDSIMRFVVV